MTWWSGDILGPPFPPFGRRDQKEDTGRPHRRCKEGEDSDPERASPELDPCFWLFPRDGKSSLFPWTESGPWDCVGWGLCREEELRELPFLENFCDKSKNNYRAFSAVYLGFSCSSFLRLLFPPLVLRIQQIHKHSRHLDARPGAGL